MQKFTYSRSQSKWRNSFLGAILLALSLNPVVAQAQLCTPGSFTWSVAKFGAHFDTLALVQRLFDGLKTYTGDQALRMHQPAAGVPNDLVIQFSSLRPTGTTVTLYYENDDVEAMTAANLATLVASYNATYAPGGTAPNAALFAHLDRNGSGTITAADFNVGGATSLNAASGDYSPIGVTLSFYNGNPAAGGVLVNRAYSPINIISPSVYSFDTVSTGAFTHVQVASWADNAGDDPRVIEIEINKFVNNNTNTITTTCLQLAKAWAPGAIAGNVASIGATTGGANNTPAFTSTASTNASSASVEVLVGNTITFPAEAMLTGTLNNYNTTRTCTSNGGVTTNAQSNTNGQSTGTLLIGAGEAGESIVCTYTNTIKTADLALTKTNTPGVNGNVDQANDTVIRGLPTTYQIVVTNNGPDAITGAVVTDPATTGLTCTALTCAGAACPGISTVAALQGAGLVLGALPVSGTATLNLTCTVN